MTFALAILILLALPAFVAMLRRYPQRRSWAFVAVGALPLLTNLPVIGFLYGWPGWNGTVRGIGVSIVVSLSLALLMTRPRIRAPLPFWWLFGFYGFALATSIFAASLWPATLFVWWQFLSALLIFAAVGGEGHQPVVRASILGGFSLGLMYQAAFSISQKLSGVTQAPGTFGHQNILGLAIEFSLLPLFAALLGGDRRKILIAGIVAAMVCVAGSGSRATMGIVGAAIVILALASLARRATPTKFRIVSFGVVALAVFTPLAIGTLNDRFQGESFIVGDSERERFEQMARAIASDYPFGVGANQFVAVANVEGYSDRAGTGWQVANRSVPVHNAYLLARAETGWMGEFAFILMLAVPMIMALRLAFQDRRFPGGEVVLGCAIALAANMIHNTYEYATHSFEIQALLFINLGLIAAELRNRKVAARQARLEKVRKAVAKANSPAPDRVEPAAL